MKNLFVASLAIVLFGLTIGCQGPVTPSFKNLEDVKMLKASKNNVIIKANAVYHNPNAVGGTLTQTKMKILVNDIEVSEINQRHEIAVPKQSDFKVPVTIQFNPQKLSDENKGFFKNAIKSFFQKNLKLTYTGKVVIRVLNIDFDVPVDYSEKVSLDLNYTEEVN